MTDSAPDGQPTPEDLLVMIDAISISLVGLRRQVMHYIEVPTRGDGSCKHLRTDSTFEETICCDCGETIQGAVGASAGG